MSKQIGSIALAAAILVTGGLQCNVTRAAEECLSAPNARAPQGSHWHYRTDRATQQKCWYLRPKDQPVQQVTPQDTAEPAPAAKSVSAPVPRTETQATTGEGTQKAAMDVSPQQRSPRQAQPAPSATVNWPTPAPLVRSLTSEGAVAAPEEKQEDSTRQQQVADSQVAEFAQGDAQNTEPGPAADNAPGGLSGLLTASPLGIFLIVAMALAMAGILSRLVMKIVTARRGRIYVDQGEQDWIESIAPEHAPSIAARPADLALAPAERVDGNGKELESALRQFMRELDRRRAA